MFAESKDIGIMDTWLNRLASKIYFHSGRTDSDFGHHDYKNNMRAPDYHWHHGLPAHLHPCEYQGKSLIDLFKCYNGVVFTNTTPEGAKYVFRAKIEIEIEVQYFLLEITGKEDAFYLVEVEDGEKKQVEPFWGTDLKPKYTSRKDSPWTGEIGGFDYLVNEKYFRDLIRKYCNIEGSGESIYDITLEAALDEQMKQKPQIQQNGSWVDASREEVLQYLDPTNYSEGNYKYQFLDLSALAGIRESDMDKYLEGKGILAGKSSIYLRAAQEYNISEVYLAAHSTLETGGGTSELATGVVVNGVTVYNMYGIAAYDQDPIGEGSKFAYNMGWDTPEKAIEGGAKWISEQYINNALYKQNTLYKMRWNPASPGLHQYATDIGWAVKQTTSIKNMYDNFPNAILKFDIPRYKQ